MKVYTSGEVAKMCTVAATTVNKWFDSGQLKGFRIPGSRHRRIPRGSLIQFLRNHQFPLAAVEKEGWAQVLFVSRDEDLIARLQGMPWAESGLSISITPSAFEAGIQSESSPPDCVVVDFCIGKVEARQFCHTLRRSLAEAIVIALVPTESDLTQLDRSGITEVFAKPFDPDLLAERIRTLTGIELDEKPAR